jgi:MFS family permease
VTSTFTALRVRNFRLFVTGQLVSNTGTWMQRVAQDWLVLSLSGGSGVALGLTTSLQFLPILLFTLFGGVIADRLPKRKVLVCTQATMGLQAFTLGVLTIAGVAQVWMVYVLALLLGTAAAVDTPVRQSFVSEMVGRRDLTNAVALNSATFNLGRVLGPAVAGLLISLVGTGPVFLINSASYAGVITGLALMRRAELHPAQRAPRGKGALRAGLSYVRHRHDLILVILTAGAVGTFGLNFQITIALLATQVFGTGARSFGLLTTAFALGSLCGALLAARRAGRTGRRPELGLVLGLALAFGTLTAISGLAPTYGTFFVLLVPTGLTAIAFATSANAFVQTGAAPHMRGRVMATYMLCFTGGTPLGALAVGWLAEAVGPRWSLIGGGLATVLVTGLLLALVRVRESDRAAALAAVEAVPEGAGTVRTSVAPEGVDPAAAELVEAVGADDEDEDRDDDERLGSRSQARV